GPSALRLAGQLLERTAPLEPRRATFSHLRAVVSGPAAPRNPQPPPASPSAASTTDATAGVSGSAASATEDGATEGRAPENGASESGASESGASENRAPANSVAENGIADDGAADGRLVADEVVATFFPGPRSYTGQDVVEISAHGSPVILAALVTRACRAGARLAEPGEFTLRAYLAGRRDLVQAEAVADLVDAVTPLQARVAFDQLQGTLTSRIAALDARLFELIAVLEASLDFPDEGYHFVDPGEALGRLRAVEKDLARLLGDGRRGRLIREGATVVIAGRTNVGKSSLFNRLAGADRAIVTDVPGTTRDLISEQVNIAGLAVTLVDTAGWRVTADPVEREGVSRGERARAVAGLTVLVLDGSAPLGPADRELLAAVSAPRLVVLNKADLPDRCDLPIHEGVLRVSAHTGDGIEALRAQVAAALGAGTSDVDTVAISNVRHLELLEQVQTHLAGAREALQASVAEEFVLADLQQARVHLDGVVGRRTSEDVLRHIFERFCIGK
ncbi:MAG: tRNA uridine-5-carboxymethylaminomethyl(34) synthesis GTPase MnmE, partial [Acidobacteria bacterium]|nr:tRNA uridine-5-carboxymethylaminomethyl(34) synthesis GTPase MnmE [Acidobacteriota bacterium]